MVFVLETRPLYRVAYIHAVRHAGRQRRNYPAFRDRLRSDPAARRAHVELKRHLGSEFADNRDAYTAAKASLISELLSDVQRY